MNIGSDTLALILEKQNLSVNGTQLIHKESTLLVGSVKPAPGPSNLWEVKIDNSMLCFFLATGSWDFMAGESK